MLCLQEFYIHVYIYIYMSKFLSSASFERYLGLGPSYFLMTKFVQG